MERLNKATSECAKCEYYFNSVCIYQYECHKNGFPNSQISGVGEKQLRMARIELAKDYIAKALKLIEEVEK